MTSKENNIKPDKKPYPSVDCIETINRFLIISKEMGSIGEYFENDDEYYLEKNLRDVLSKSSKLNTNSTPDQFDDFLESIDESIINIFNLFNILDNVNGMLTEIFNMILVHFIPDNYYDELE